MIVIRKFKDQLLDSIATWGPCDAFGEFLPRAVEDSIQINVLVAKNTKKSKHSNRLGNGATAYYLFSPTDDYQAEIDELLLAHKVVGIAQLLTRREFISRPLRRDTYSLFQQEQLSVLGFRFE